MDITYHIDPYANLPINVPNPATLFPGWMVHPAAEHEVITDTTVAVVLDAVREGRKLTPEMLIGLPCTIEFCADFHASKVIDVTPSCYTITTKAWGKEIKFRWSRKFKRYRNPFRNYLYLGEAIDRTFS